MSRVLNQNNKNKQQAVGPQVAEGDIEDEGEHSLYFRDHEISRQIVSTKSTRNKPFNTGLFPNNQGINHTTDEILNKGKNFGLSNGTRQAISITAA